MSEHDVHLIAQYAKTYADGEVWEAACRVLGALRDPEEPQPGARVAADVTLEWMLYERRRS